MLARIHRRGRDRACAHMHPAFMSWCLTTLLSVCMELPSRACMYAAAFIRMYVCSCLHAHVCMELPCMCCVLFGVTHTPVDGWMVEDFRLRVILLP